MKELLLLFATLLLGVEAFSQTQQGFVRTLGRPDKKGEALEGVIVRVKGEHNTILSDEEGNFSMLLAGLKNGEAYSLQQVQKTGYELNEADFIGRQLAFSDKVPLTIVMVSTAQLQAEIQRIENNAYKTAEKNYNTKIEQLEKQKDDNRITIAQYQKKIQDLYDKFEKYQSLIEGLAEHYAHTDYDLLSEKDREINICIENGELERADSLIRLLFDPINVLERNKEALAHLDQQIDEANQLLDQADHDMAAVLKQQGKDAEYLYQLYTIALARFDNEKALYYIETRAELDTINPGWQFDAGYCFQKYNDFIRAKKFYSRALIIYRGMAKDNPHAYEPELASTLNNLAILYKNTQHLTESETLYLEALESYRRLVKDKPKYKPLYPSRDKSKDKSKDYEPDVARTLNNLALLYSNTQRFSESETMYLEALEIRRRLAEKDPDTYEPGSAMTMNNLALLYSNTQRLTESEILQLEALEILRRLAKDNPKTYEPDLAMTLNNLAVLYSNTQRPNESTKLYLEVLEIFRRLAKENPQTYEPALATTLNNLANLYDNAQRYTESDPIRLEALEIYRRLAIDNPQLYEPILAMTLNNLAVSYKNTHRLKESEPLFLEALEIFRRLKKDGPQSLEPYMAKALSELADLYYDTQRVEESESLYLQALEFFKRLDKDAPQTYDPDLVATLSSLAYMYYRGQRFTESEAMYLDAIVIYRRLTNSNAQVFEPRLANSLYSLGLLYRQQERNLQAIPVFEEALEHYKSLVLHNPSYKKWLDNTVQLLNQLATDIVPEEHKAE
ncbi:MAG: tetratricopeptide repeat protein [Bacteroidales bacterium]|nr:tetratricopeptide repeat protein [Bacteroidales bacterium]